MNLLFYVPQMAAYGGIERHVCGLAVAAAAEGHTILLLTTSNSLGPELRKELNHPLITFRELNRPRLSTGPFGKIIWLFKELRRARRNSWDVIYTNGQSALSRFIWQAAGPKTRIFHHHHNAADEHEQSTWSSHYRKVLKKVPHLIGCSRATCTAINRAIGRSDAQFLPYLAAAPVRREQISDRQPGSSIKFGFCGRLIPEKGIDTILALAKSPALSDLEWHIHGAGEAYPPERFSGQRGIVYHGAYRTTEEHARALLGLDAIVLFSRHNEGMPLSLIEAMSAGLPWIATDRGGTRELATSPTDSVVAPPTDDLNTMQTYVRQLANCISEGQTSRLRQREHYDARFSTAVVSKLWLAAFTA